MGFIENVGDANKIADAIQNVAKILALFNQPRSVILEIDNHTDLRLTKISEHLDHGGWAETPQGEIPPQTAMIFGAQSATWSIATGTQGNIVYRGAGIDLTVSWDNPFIGSNSSDLQITGINAGNYRMSKECGSGNTNAHMRYEVFPMAVHLLAPQANTALSGAVTLTAQATGVLGVAFKAYYATDPGTRATRGWHQLGTGTQQAPGEWSFQWKSASIPDQGREDWETVKLCAYAIDAQGNELTPHDCRRVTVQNQVGFFRVTATVIDTTHWQVHAVDTVKGPVTQGEVRVNSVVVGPLGQVLPRRPRVTYSEAGHAEPGHPGPTRWVRRLPQGEVRAPTYPRTELDLSHVWIDDGPPNGADLNGS